MANEVEKLKHENSRLISSLAELQAENEILMEENEEASDQISRENTFRDEIEHLKQCRNDLCDEVVDLEDENSSLKEKIKKFEFLKQEQKKYLYDIHVEVMLLLTSL